jgi:hypothetical protein
VKDKKDPVSLEPIDGSIDPQSTDHSIAVVIGNKSTILPTSPDETIPVDPLYGFPVIEEVPGNGE